MSLIINCLPAQWSPGKLLRNSLHFLPRSLWPWILCLCCLSLISLGLSLYHGLLISLARRGGPLLHLLCSGGLLLHPSELQSHLLRPGGLQSRLLHSGWLLFLLLHPGGFLFRLLRPGGSLLCWPCPGLWLPALSVSLWFPAPPWCLGDSESTGKLRGGGTCFYINERWCTNLTVLKKMCC